MKTKKLFTSLSFLTLALGAFSFATIINDSSVKEPAVIEAWSTDVKPSVAASYYSAADGKTGSQLRNALADFNKPTSPSYDWSRYEAADEAQDDSSAIYCVYTRHNIPKNAHVGSGYSWDKWNREHVYTQSSFPASDKDNHNIFACEGQINNTRGNLPYDEVQGKSGASRISEFGHTTDCYYISGTSFEPCDEAKGEIARACLYCTIYYGYDLSQIFVDKNIALKWNAMYPVTAREIYRNNVVYTLQGNRNPFIDHPSYAQKIYDGPAYQGTDPLSDEGVTITPSSASIEKGKTVTLTAVASDSSAITWTTSNSSIATVSSSGVVTGVNSGTAQITATSSTVGSASATITVTEPAVLSSISVSGQKTSYVVGDSFVKPTVTATYSDSSSKDVTNSATFSNYDLNTEGNYTVNVSYKEETITKTTSYDITVAPQGQVVVEASVKGDKTFYVGEYISNSDIDVYVDNVKTTSFLFNGSNNYSYQFTYEDAASGGAITNKVFENAISASGGVGSLTAKVKRKERGSSESVTDVMTANDLTATDTSYTPFSNVSLTSSARYAGNSAKNTAGNIQLKSKNSNSGIVSTTSGGNLTSVRIVVGSGSNTVQIYGKNTAYSSASDLYDSTKQGTQIGSCSSTSTINITGEYAYVGIRSASGALYLSSVEFTYGSEDTAENVANYIMYEDTANQCKTKTTIAKGYFEQLSKEERTLFMESSEYVISKGRERLLAWLKNQGMEIESSNNDYVINANSASIINGGETDNISLIIIITVSAVSSCLLLGVLILKKRRYHK